MKAKERVSAALQHQAPTDRVPIFMWFHPDTARLLGTLLEIPPGQVGDAFGNDICQTWVNNNFAMEGIVHEQEGEWHIDEWGIRWMRSFGFNQIETYPLANNPAEKILDYRFPVDKIEDLFQAMDRAAAQRQDQFLGCDVSPCVFEMYWRLRGIEAAMLDIADTPDLAAEMFQRCAGFAAALAEEAFRRYPLDWLWTGDDVASQTQMMLSPKTWRKLVKPALQQVFNVGKAHATRIAYHCCGALSPIIPDLIEMGMDVLNPIQVNCPGMDIYDLKREYGKQITLMGGLDTQYLLPYGTETEVRQAVRRLLDVMEPDGGYILAASHTIPPETPIENIFALYLEAGVSRTEIFERAAELRSRSPEPRQPTSK